MHKHTFPFETVRLGLIPFTESFVHDNAIVITVQSKLIWNGSITVKSTIPLHIHTQPSPCCFILATGISA